MVVFSYLYDTIIQQCKTKKVPMSGTFFNGIFCVRPHLYTCTYARRDVLARTQSDAVNQDTVEIFRNSLVWTVEAVDEVGLEAIAGTRCI